jgi:hypothetical protein
MAPRARGGIAPTHSSALGMSGQCHDPAALYPRERDRRLGGPLDTEARGKIQCLCRGSKDGKKTKYISKRQKDREIFSLKLSPN